MARPGNAKTVETLTHDEARRKNIPTAEYQAVLPTEQQQPKPIRYPLPATRYPRPATRDPRPATRRRRSTSRRRCIPRC